MPDDGGENRGGGGGPSRPVLRYHGGKWRLAPWIVSHFPAHRIYVEPYGGGGSVLMRKPRAYAEVYNDLDDEVVNVFRVLRDRSAAVDLRRALELTPYSRSEFSACYEPGDFQPIERARRTIIQSYMGFGSAGASRKHKTGFRNNATRRRTTPAHDWSGFPECLPAFVSRLDGVIVDSEPALRCIARHDGPETLFYVDPPYPWSTRSFPRGAAQPHGYRHEMTDEDHRALADALHQVAGMVVLSGYACALYDVELYPDWHRIKTAARGDGAVERTEVLWMNAATVRARGDLFGSGAGS